jgi:hypothetical protein
MAPDPEGEKQTGKRKLRENPKNYYKCTRYKQSQATIRYLSVRYKKGKTQDCKGDCKIV